MPAIIRISKKMTEDCASLICHVNGSNDMIRFVSALNESNYTVVREALKEVLSDRSPDGMPVGKRGLPLQRFAAETLVGKIDKALGSQQR